MLVTDWDKQFDGDDDPNVMLFDANGGGDGMNVSSPQPGQRPPSSERNPRSATEQGAVPDKESGVLPLQAVLPVEGNVGEDEDVLMLGDYNVDEDLEGFVVDGVASAAESGAWETTNERPRSGVKVRQYRLKLDIQGHFSCHVHPSSLVIHGEQCYGRGTLSTRNLVWSRGYEQFSMHKKMGQDILVRIIYSGYP